MPQDVSPRAVPDTRPIHRLIRRTRLLLRSSWVLTGFGLSLGLLLGTLAAVSLADVFMPIAPEIGLTPERSVLPYLAIPGWILRLIGLVVIVVPALWVLLIGVVRPLLRRLAPVHVARRIEAHIPGIHNRLVSCLDLDANEQKRVLSPAFHRRLVQEALERIRAFHVRSVVDFLSLRRAGVFTAVTLAGFCLAWLLFSDRLAVAMARIFDPFADIPPLSGVVYTVAPGDTKVLRGEDVPFAVRVEQGEPEKLWLELRSSASGEHLRYDLERQKLDPHTWAFTLGSANIAPGFENAFRYRVHGGGTWSKQYQVTMIERPNLVGYHTVLHYPDYMGIEPRVGAPMTLEVTGPEGSQVEVVVKSEGQVSAGDIQLLEFRQPGPDVKDRPERAWFEDQTPPGAVPDGTWTWDSQKHQRPAHTEPPALGLHGHWFQGAAEAFAVQPGDNLFVWVYLPPEQKPEALVVEWHDGTNWEHRAIWGSDKVSIGKAGTPGHRQVGPLPQVGQWVRLEVPAEQVGLHGKGLRGMSFKVQGGQCYWSRAGVLPPVLGVRESYPLQAADENEWAGRFPLHGTGLYRVELRNELGYANKTMKEAKYVAIPDNPPQIVLERPGADLVLSTPGKVPLVLSAFDDFGLAEVSLVMQRGADWEWKSQPLKRYDKPVRSDNLAATLDLAELKMQTGDSLRYRVEARDRKGQVARTQDFTIRIAVDPSAADEQLAAFEKTQDPFREKLTQLLAQQAKVHAAVEKLNAKYALLAEKIKTAQAEIQPAPEAAPKGAPPKPAPTETPLKLDPEATKMLQELQKDLGQLAQQEQQNVQMGEQVSSELAKSAEQMSGLKMMPQQLTQQMQALQQLFQKLGVGGMKNLQSQMTKGADAKQPAPDLKAMQQLSDRVQKELEALQQRLQSLAEARGQMRNNLNEALGDLERQMLRQNTGLTARELEELRDHIAQLRDELKRLEGNQEKLNESTKQANDKDLSEMEKKQLGLDKQLENLLAEARNLLGNEKTRRMKRRPTFPDEPYLPDAGEEKVRPKEEDTDEPPKKDGDPKSAAAKGDKKDEKKADKKDDEPEEPLYLPALGGPKPKIDPRFAQKVRPIVKKPQPNSGAKEDPAAHREDLAARQEQRLREANQAEQSLASDQSALEQLLRQIEQAMRPGQPHEGQPMGEGAEQQLAQLLRSPSLQQALAMAARMRQGGNRSPRPPGQPPPNQATQGNLEGSPAPTAALDGELAKLDPAARGMILKLSPRVREELLQGMREEGPEGYRKFIEDYFKRLTEVKGTK